MRWGWRSPPKGAATVRRLIPGALGWEDKATAGMSAREVAAVKRSLAKMYENLTASASRPTAPRLDARASRLRRCPRAARRAPGHRPDPRSSCRRCKVPMALTSAFAEAVTPSIASLAGLSGGAPPSRRVVSSRISRPETRGCRPSTAAVRSCFPTVARDSRRRRPNERAAATASPGVRSLSGLRPSSSRACRRDARASGRSGCASR